MSNTLQLTIKQAIEHGSEKIAAVSDSATLDSQVLLAHCLDKGRSYLMTWPDKYIDDKVIKQFQQLIARRQTGEPIAYLVGHKEFWSMELGVSSATLIPRPDTEVLVEQVLSDCSNQQGFCLDLGTGTGAIALAIANERPGWQVEAVDLQQEAVELARQNAHKLQLSNVTIYQSSWYSNIDSSKRFDVIVSNPPYIDANDPHLSQGDVRFEPSSALIAAQQGLADIRLIAERARPFFAKKGRLYLEHGYDQAESVRAILHEFGYDSIQTIKDYNNNDRVTCGHYVNSVITEQ